MSTKTRGKKRGPAMQERGKNWKGSKDDRRIVEAEDSVSKMYSKRNDKAWYDRYPQITKDAGSVAMAVPVGKDLAIQSEISDPTFISDYKIGDWVSLQQRAAGVVAIGWIPTIGRSQDKSSPINRAALNLFVQLRSKQKAAKDYDSQDMMMGILALDSAHSYHAFCRRAYAVARMMQTPTNYYFTKTVIAAMNIDPDDLIANMANFRAWINMFGVSLSKYTLPAGLDLTARHMWMSEGIYMDADSTKGQAFMFVPDYLFQYNNTVPKGSQLDPVAIRKAENPLKVADLIAIGQDMLNAINGDDDIGYICGDLEAAYGMSAMRSVPMIDESTTIVPSYNMEVLAQISNIYFAGEVADCTITQNPDVNQGAILQNVICFFSNENFGKRQWVRHMLMSPILNIRGNSEPINNIEATRLMAWGVAAMSWPNTSDPKLYSVKMYGSEICTTFTVFTKPIEQATSVITAHEIPSTNSLVFMTTDTEAGIALWNRVVTAITQFDWSWNLFAMGAGTSGTVSLDGIYGDLHNVSAIKPSDLEQMHEAALVSEFDMPGVTG